MHKLGLEMEWMAVKWDRREDRAHWATAYALDGSRVHLVVEKLPHGGWDWAVWRNDRSGDGCSGVAPTAKSAAVSARETAALMVADAQRDQGALAA